MYRWFWNAVDYFFCGIIMYFKGVWHEIFDLSFFHESVSPGPLSNPLWSFRLFSKIRRDIRKWMFISGVNDTGDKLFGGVNNTGAKVFGGVNDTSD